MATTTTTTREVGGERRGAVVVRAQQMGAPLPPMEQHDPLPCPRCTSTHTKFCYYNNYNFSQPRHFCKSCRRYWTHGGTLRDIPVGGASRKTAKRSRTTTSSPSALSLPPAPPVINNSNAHGMLFTSLLSDNGGFGLGLDEIGFGLRPRVWAGPYGLTNNETNSSGYNHGGGGVSRNDTWHVESGEPLLGFVGADHCFTSLPELAISTSPNALK